VEGVRLLIEHNDISGAMKEVNMGSGKLVVAALVVSLIAVALVSFNMLVAKDWNLFLASLTFSGGTVIYSAGAIRFLRNRTPIPMLILITARKFRLYKVLLCVALITWFITQIVILLSVSLWALRLGFTDFAQAGRVMFFFALLVIAVVAALATWGKFTQSPDVFDGRKDDDDDCS